MVELASDENDWQAPFRKAFDEMPEFNLSKDTAQYQWRTINPDSQDELQNLLNYYDEGNPDQPQDILSCNESLVETKLRMLVLEVMMHRMLMGSDSLRISITSPFGISSRAPITIILSDHSLVFYKHPVIKPDSYQEYVNQLIEGSNYILKDLEREKLPLLSS